MSVPRRLPAWPAQRERGEFVDVETWRLLVCRRDTDGDRMVGSRARREGGSTCAECPCEMLLHHVPPTVSGWRRRVMQHLDVRADEDRQKVLCPLQRTGVGGPGLREDPLGVGAVGVDGQAR